MAGPTTFYVDTREGPAPVTVPGDIMEAVAAVASTDDERNRALHLAALVLVRAGAEAGTTLLRHWVEHDPTLLVAADPLLPATLAEEPELIVGPLGGTSPVSLDLG